MKRAIAYPVLLLLLGAVILAAAALSMLVGPQGIGFSDLLGIIERGDGDIAWTIISEIRLPRTILAVTIGATLGLAGATLQGFLRNPLADPAVVGVSSTAALGAVLTLYTGLATTFPLALPVAGIAGGLACVLLLQGFAGRGGVLTLILAGVAISSLAGALTSLALNLSPNPYAAVDIVLWLLGSVTNRSMDHVLLATPFMLAGWAVLAWTARSLDALSLGEEAAVGLGVDLNRTRLLVITGTALSVGAAVAVSGAIGFVGLVVPHLLRPLVGHSPSRLLPASALGGAALLTLADVLVRVVLPGGELLLGVATALIGAPFFIWLVVRTRTELES
jgi:iron complex transport system permease protein